MLIKYGEDSVEVIGKYGDDATRIIMDYSDDGFTALKNGVIPKQINEINEIGLTPNDFNKVDGKIRNLKVESAADAQALIDLNRKIHSLFTDDELSQLKNNILEQQELYRKDVLGKTAGSPAYAGVVYKNADGELEFFYGINNMDNTDIPDILQTATSGNDSLISKMKNNLDNLDPSEYLHSTGAGTHAEIYAVCDLLKKYPDANIDDFVVFVNYTKPFNQPATGHAFFTCPHCREILKDLNILSNVEGF